jgi:histidinol-phosphate/aromatic aminotransferase/cobyric acid decarboxylase-like protein
MDRVLYVLYVQECMHAHPGPGYEMTSKCVCVLDTLAEQMGYADFVSMNTVSKATSIAGERGGALRDAPALAEQLKRFRTVQGQAEKACFIAPGSR